MDKLFFTEEEFNNLRQDIVDVLTSNGLNDYYQIKKSTYKWSSEYNFIIRVSTYSNTVFRHLTPEKKIKVLKTLFDTISSFISESEKNFSFLNLEATSEFSYTFVFQPSLIRAKALLENK